jgi:hypothetical protein
MGERVKYKYGLKFKQADEFQKIQKELPELIQAANIPREKLIEKVGTTEPTFYRKLKLCRYSANDIIKYMAAIIEIKNETEVQTLKQLSNG